MNVKIQILKYIINAIVFIEYLGSLPQRLVFTFFRLGLYSIILTALFLGYFVNSASPNTHSLNYIFNSNVSLLDNVLGQESVREVPFIFNTIPFPPVTSESIIVVDVINNKILFEKNMHQKLSPASTTKLMTALISLDNFEIDNSLQVSEVCTKVESQRVGLTVGEEIKVLDLLSSVLIGSAGDSACVLSAATGNPQGFVSSMNDKAASFGMLNTSFSNAIGLDGNNYSTAYDLYLLAQQATSKSLIKEIVKKQEHVFASGAYPRTISSTNNLLWEIPGSVGVKTGRTTEAGEVLIYEYDYDSQNIVIVVMKSQDRFNDVHQILNWVFTTYSWDV